MKILLTGGAGYIGSHTALALLEANYEVVVVDNLSNSSIESLRRVEAITHKKITFYQDDIRNKQALLTIFNSHHIEGVIHFAGLKAVGQSVEQPLDYYNNNITGTLTLCKTMQEVGCKTLVFSSSATVYGKPKTVPITENFALSATNPYGRSKLMIEEILADLFTSDATWQIVCLRYFNPVGAHASGLIGEDPNGKPSNLMPFIAQVAVGKHKKVQVFGVDYDTLDGTGARDYIHVCDLAQGHLKALEALHNKPQLLTVNLGTGQAYTVLEVITAFEQVTGKHIDYEIVNRRTGDIDICYTNTQYAKQTLGWQAQYDLTKMCQDTWNWQTKNPNGYQA